MVLRDSPAGLGAMTVSTMVPISEYEMSSQLELLVVGDDGILRKVGSTGLATFDARANLELSHRPLETWPTRTRQVERLAVCPRCVLNGVVLLTIDPNGRLFTRSVLPRPSGP